MSDNGMKHPSSNRPLGFEGQSGTFGVPDQQHPAARPKIDLAPQNAVFVVKK